ncbi:signal peptidase I [Vagococcus silagei]|uniref:Signal peptidase I n=1 Tax=Vagococcus silagei TaxID=2508885 RepID=A0A4V3TUX9_9ENTE|nr:signal peptidase I [Vagococcus silagei]THB60699.1 signal peptidase I [Vagococcus silagei]
MQQKKSGKKKRKSSSRDHAYQRDESRARKSNKTKGKKSQATLKNKKSEKKTLVSIILNILFYVITISIIFGAVLFTVSKDSNKSFFGYRFYTVLTNSMMPKDPKTQKGGFAAGDMIIIKKVDPKSLEVGDIITYDLMVSKGQNDAVLTHRIIKKLENFENSGDTYFETQGDFNTGKDGRPVSPDQINGKKVFVIPKVGKLMTFLRENWFVSIGLILATFALIQSLKFYFSKSKIEKRKPKRRKV